MLIDIICLILLIMAIFKGMSKGFIVAVFSFAAFFIGMMAALKLSSTVAQHLNKTMNISGYWLPFIAFTLVFTAVILAIKLSAGVIKKLAGFFLLGWLDGLLGIVLYAAMYLIVFSVVLFFTTRIKLISEESRQSSKTYAYVAPVGPAIVNNAGKIIPVFRGIFEDLNKYFDTVAKKQGI